MRRSFAITMIHGFDIDDYDAFSSHIRHAIADADIAAAYFLLRHFAFALMPFFFRH